MCECVQQVDCWVFVLFELCCHCRLLGACSHIPCVNDFAIRYCSAEVADTSSPSVVDEVCLFRVVIQKDCEPSIRSTVATTT